MNKLIFGIIILLLFFPIFIFARQGCCSHHGGVSHCDSSVGIQVCNDGSYSPSCGCYKKVSPAPTPSSLVQPSNNKPAPEIKNKLSDEISVQNNNNPRPAENISIKPSFLTKTWNFIKDIFKFNK